MRVDDRRKPSAPAAAFKGLEGATGGIGGRSGIDRAAANAARSFQDA